jgi:molybdenum cofactor cytidylyltransferase
VLPDCTTLVVVVVGIDAVGLPLTAKYIHRPERVAAIWPGETVAPQMVARVLVHPLGGRKGVPVGARVVALLNKVETGVQHAVATEIVQEVRLLGGIEAVVVGAVADRSRPFSVYSI